ncbi:MAG: hypothetical protein ABI068_14330, partial [Ktedonobacterales bacterium]
MTSPMPSDQSSRPEQSVSGLIIRPAVDSDWPHIWPIYEQIVAAGETYAHPEPPVMEVARSLWMEQPPSRTVVAVADGVVLGSAKMGPNRPG